MNNELPIRKHPRLKRYNYNNNGAYFITVCVKDRREIFGKVITVGRDVHIAPDDGIPSVPQVILSEYGNIVDKHIKIINSTFKDVQIDKYVIMPNHIHMIIVLNKPDGNMDDRTINDIDNGAMRTSRPTVAIIPKIMRSFKTMVTKEIGFSLWQKSYHDHIIRNENEYWHIWKYIDKNSNRWEEDHYHQL